MGTVVGEKGCIQAKPMVYGFARVNMNEQDLLEKTRSNHSDRTGSCAPNITAPYT